MPIAGQSLLQLKELELSYPTCALVSIAMVNGPTLYLCSRVANFGSTLTWNNNTYYARISNSNPGAKQATSQMGIDAVGTYSIDIADADWEYTRIEAEYGFQGAQMKAVVVMYDPDTNQYSSDSTIQFAGVCNSPNRKGNLLTVTATANYDLRKKLLPDVPVQVTCPWNFPTTDGERADGNNNPLSIFYQCGYCPPIIGNFQSGTNYYTTCSKSKSDCVARGMYLSDSQGRYTSRFGGVQWQPPATWKGKSYTAGKTAQGINSVNTAKYSDYAPEPYGTTWVTGISANVVGDPNYTTTELIVANGSLDLNNDILQNGILRVVENNLLLPNNKSTSDNQFNWRVLTPGTRSGAVNATAIYNSSGDPYGSLCVIAPTVYSQVQSSNSAPEVSVLVGPRPIPVLANTNPNSYTFQRSDNAAWVILEILRRAGIAYSAWDIQSVIRASYTCGQGIAYTKFDGSTSYHQRYRVSICLDKQTSIGTIINGLKTASRLMITPNINGILRMVVKQTLCAQQGSAVAGSNDQTGYASYQITDNPYGQPSGTGYFAYSFDESNINEGTFELMQSDIPQQPDVLVAQIQDEDNDWTPDTVTNGDDVAYNRIGQKVQSTIAALGLPNYDQANRALETQQYELYRANPRGDSGGSWIIKFTTSFRALHLNQGDIVSVTWQALELVQQAFRILTVQYSPDFESTMLTMLWHDDRAYTDQYGQGQSPYFQTTGDFGGRPPYPWQPNQVGNCAADPMYAPGRGANAYRTFQLEVGAEEKPDQSIVPDLIITGQETINKYAGSGLAPQLASQGTTALSGGTIPDGTTLFCYVSAINGNGHESPLQVFPCTVNIIGGYNTNTATIGILYWPPGTVSWKLYAGPLPQLFGLSASGTGTPATITIPSFSAYSASPVDTRFDHYILRAKHVSHAGYLVLGPGLNTQVAAANTVTSNTITFQYAVNLESNQFYTPNVNELAGYTMMACYVTGGGVVPFVNLKITSNTGYACTIDMSGGAVDLTTLGLGQVWFVVMRKITSFGGTTIQFADSGTNTSGWSGGYLRVLAGSGVTNPPMKIVAGNYTGAIAVSEPPLVPLDSTSIVVIEEATWRINDVGSPLSNSASGVIVNLNTQFANDYGQFWFAQVSSADSNNRETPDIGRPYRLFFWQGSPAGQPLYQGLNLIPNSDLSEPGNGSGEIVAGWTIVGNPSNQYLIIPSTDSVYSGKYSFRFSAGPQTIPGTPNSSNPAFGPVASISNSNAAPYPLPRPGEKYQANFTARYTTSSPPAAGCSLEVVFRIVVNYTDGTFDQAPQPGGVVTSQNTWQTFTSSLTVNANKTPNNFYTNLQVYWVNVNTGATTTLPAGGSFFVFVGGLKMIKIIDLNTEASSSTSNFMRAQASMVPTESIAIQPRSITPNALTLGWNAETKERSHETPLQVKAGNVTFSDLQPSTEYFFDPYVEEETGEVRFGHGSGTPPTYPDSLSAILAAKDGRHPQRSFSITTPASTASAQSGSSAGKHPDTATTKKRWVWSAMEQVEGFEHPQPVVRKYAHPWRAPVAMEKYELVHCAMTVSALQEARTDDRVVILDSLRSQKALPKGVVEGLARFGVTPEMNLHEALEHLGETVDPQFLPEH